MDEHSDFTARVALVYGISAQLLRKVQYQTACKIAHQYTLAELARIMLAIA